MSSKSREHYLITILELTKEADLHNNDSRINYFIIMLRVYVDDSKLCL